LRLDRYLYSRDMVRSRTRAKELILKGAVKVDSKVVKKPSFEVSQDSIVEIEGDDIFVSRAGEKLWRYLQKGALNPAGSTVLDVGASTGGFTQVMLLKGAASVTALDVGKLQLHESLRRDPRVKVLEETDIRDFSPAKRYDIVTCDVSFISLLSIADYLDGLFLKNLLVLFKPQFEVGKEAKRDSKGVVKDQKAIKEAMRRFESLAEEKGWILIDKSPSEIKGKEGNQEYFYLFERAK